MCLNKKKKKSLSALHAAAWFRAMRQTHLSGGVENRPSSWITCRSMVGHKPPGCCLFFEKSAVERWELWSRYLNQTSHFMVIHHHHNVTKRSHDARAAFLGGSGSVGRPGSMGGRAPRWPGEGAEELLMRPAGVLSLFPPSSASLKGHFTDPQRRGACNESSTTLVYMSLIPIKGHTHAGMTAA